METTDPSSIRSEGEPVQRIGRFVVTERLGAGGMGVVYAAYDPQLDRKVAIKVLKDPGAPESRARMLREARAMAQLTDTNVVTVHEVGEDSGGVFIAMEYVHGSTLREWLRATSRSSTEVLRVFLDAGRGLAAAHAAGIVHRDFKPDNLLIDASGRVRVTDFGLARATATSAPPRDPSPTTRPDEATSSVSTVTLTQRGAVVGTPAYMSPEQIMRSSTDERSDQFSYCVALWEALSGSRPWEADNIVDLAARLVRDDLPAVPRGVPSWVAPVLRRGLAKEPGQRWPSMERLIGALDRGRGRARLRGLSFAIVGLVCAAAGVHEAVKWREARVLAADAAACQEEAARLVPWTREREEAVTAAFLATGVPYAPRTLELLTPRLNGSADGWRAAWAEACRMQRLEAEATELTIEKARWCLDEQRMDLDGLVGELARADPTIVQGAVEAVASSPRADRCLDERVLANVSTPPLEQRDDARRIRAEIARASALERAGDFADGLVVARTTAAEAAALGWEPLAAAADLRLGRLLDRSGPPAEAREALVDAYVLATRSGETQVAADAATSLVYVVGCGLRVPRLDEATSWARLADIAIQALGEGEDAREATRRSALGSANTTGGQPAEARGHHERALAIRERLFGPEHPEVATSLHNLGNTLRDVGDFDGAVRLDERALAIREQALGPGHPLVADTLGNLGNVLRIAGRPREAIPPIVRAQRIYLTNGDMLAMARQMSNLGVVFIDTRSPDRAVILIQLALTLLESTQGPEHADVARALAILAGAQRALGNTAVARAAHERALRIRERVRGPDHPEVAESHQNLAILLVELKAYEEAESSARAALAIFEATYGARHINVAHTLDLLGQTLLERGDAAAAVPHLARALEICDGAEAPAAVCAESAWPLARALWASSPDRPRAIALARRALSGLESGERGPQVEQELERIRAWLATRAAEPR